MKKLVVLTTCIGLTFNGLTFVGCDAHTRPIPPSAVVKLPSLCDAPTRNDKKLNDQAPNNEAPNNQTLNNQTLNDRPQRAQPSAAHIFVALDGDDTNPGTQARPFKTIQKAQEKVREQRSRQNVIVTFRRGTYPLTQPIEFTAEDGGTDKFQVIYRAFPQERVVFSGGQAITGWEMVHPGSVQGASAAQKNDGTAPDSRTLQAPRMIQAPRMVQATVGDRQFRQLYINGTRAIRARTPNVGEYFRLQNWDTKNQTINLKAADIQRATSQRPTLQRPIGHSVNTAKHTDREPIANLNQAEIVIQRDWNQSRLRIHQINPPKADITTIVPASPERERAFKQEYPFKNDQQPYHLENAIAFLDAPSEWYLDRNHHKVFYQPRSGESIATIQAIVPQIETLIQIQGTKASPVQNLAFCNLAFQHTTWLAPDQQGYVGTQAGIPYDSDPAPAAIVVKYANHITFERNLLQHLGGMGILLSTGTHDAVVNANRMTDIADNGIAIGIPIEDTQDPTEQVSDHRISNNYVAQVGQDYFGSVGIFAGYASGLQIEHNELTDLPYSAISVGWGWTDQDSSLRHNLIRYNHVHHVMNLLFDGGAIYTLSKQPGTVISHNYIHDLIPSPWVPEGPQRQWLSGIYLDQGSSFMRLQDNVIINVPTKITQQSVAPSAKNNQLINNDRDLLQVKARSGIEAADRDIKNRLIP